MRYHFHSSCGRVQICRSVLEKDHSPISKYLIIILISRVFYTLIYVLVTSTFVLGGVKRHL